MGFEGGGLGSKSRLVIWVLGVGTQGLEVGDVGSG